MTNKEVIDFLKSEKEATRKLASTCNSDRIDYFTKHEEAYDIAIKSLEAWEIIKDNLSQQIHHNLDAKENFEIGSISRIECNTTASVLAGVIYLIDKHLSELEDGV